MFTLILVASILPSTEMGIKIILSPQFEGCSSDIIFSCENVLKTEALQAIMPHISIHSLHQGIEIKLNQYESDMTELKVRC